MLPMALAVLGVAPRMWLCLVLSSSMTFRSHYATSSLSDLVHTMNVMDLMTCYRWHDIVKNKM